MSTAFVFSGGGSHAAMQAGMVLALEEHGIVPDLVVGSSAGALNAAYIAGRPYRGAAQELVEAWHGLRRKDVVPSNMGRGIAGILGGSDYLVNSRGLRRFISQGLTFSKVEDAPVRFTCIATNLLTGSQVELTSGDAIDAITASASLPGIYSPVEIDGTLLIDGGVSNNVPVESAIRAGATTIYVLPAGHACALAEPPRGALHVLFHSLSVLLHERLSTFVESFDGDADLHIVPILCPMKTSILDFSQSAEIIDRAYVQTQSWLSGGYQVTTTSGHTH